MDWNRNWREGSDPADLAYPPDSGGRVKMVLLGCILPLVVMGFAVSGWMDGKMYLPARGGAGEWLKGGSARSFAVAVAGMAVFCHARWFWGLRPGGYSWFEKLTLLGSLMAIGGLGRMLWIEFGGWPF